MVRRALLSTVVLALVTGVTASVVLFAPGRHVAGSPTPDCSAVQVLFDTDERMWRAAEELRGDRRVREVRDESTQALNHERLTAALREAGRDDLADAARVDRTPASLQVVEAVGVDVEEFADELRQQYRVNVVDVCEDPPRDVG